MCYNCGCHLPDDDMGYPGINIVNKTFDEAAKQSGQSADELKKKVGEMLKNNSLTPDWEERLKKASDAMGMTLEESKKNALELLHDQGLA